MKALLYPHNFSIISLPCSRTSNSEASSPIWPTFKFVWDFMPVLVTCEFEDPIKNEGAIMSTTFFCCTQGHVTLKLIDGHNQNSNSRFYVDPIKNEGTSMSTTFSALWVYGKNFQHSRASSSKANSPIWELLAAVETRVLIQSAPKPYAVFPRPQWCFK